MSRKPQDAAAASPDKALALKDGLREVRFNVKQGVRKLTEAVDAMASARDLPAPGPLAMLGEPLGLALRTTASLLSNVDHAAVSLLADDAPLRAMQAPPLPTARYFGGSADPALSLHAFTVDHGWRQRHWLKRAGHDRVFVHEAAIEAAGLQARDDLAAGGDGATAPQVLATAAAAMVAHGALSGPIIPAGECGDDLQRLTARGAIVAMLVGETYPLTPAQDPARRYRDALDMADDIMRAQEEAWLQALQSDDAVGALTRWFGFVARHL